MPRQRPGKETDIEPNERTAVLASSSAVRTAGDSPEARLPATTEASRPIEPQSQKDDGIKYATFLGKYGAIELENKGSVARDHLALERTFLAWLRTSLAFASIGIAITQLFRLNNSTHSTSPDRPEPFTIQHMGKSLGATFLGISIVVLAFGVNRYYESQGWLLKGKFPASRGSVFGLSLIAFLVIIASLVIVLVARPNTIED